ncbi:MAG: ABC-F family ATP-binding cassette domain-containing protein [Lachnospiraceae bacterium]|nr:ABC-F family ATP-binding cassette domain-containing protein [Lachnospiraceae bacterium]
MLLSIQNLNKSFGAETVLKDVSFQIEPGEKFAVVGNNGTGKSTLLKIIANVEKADDGNVVFSKDVTFGYLSQYQEDTGEGKIMDLLLKEREDLIVMEKELRDMEAMMSEKTGDELSELLNDYHEKNRAFEDNGGLTFRSEANGILKGLGFIEEEFSHDMSALSGGQKTRASLGKLLMKKPDLLMLDEPINHLDLSAIEWLEGYLQKYRGSLIIVAHDRYFMDKIVDHVVDLSDHKGSVYKGNYTDFVRLKAERQKAYAREYEKQQDEIAHQEAVIKKLKQFNREKSIKRAESREKMLDKIDRLEKPVEYKDKMRLSLFTDVTSGNDVMKIEDLSMRYGEKNLFSGFSMDLYKKQRVGIIGDNGTGKTTLLKIINNKVTPLSGTITFGTNVTIGYYDQEQQALSDEKTLFQELQDTYPDKNDTEIRNVLAAFLFTGDDVFKKISVLSGGERGRVSLAKLMLSGSNLLILDEPTNHLDMESKEILENALLSYEGTLLFVSHDRYFINRIATDIYELSGETFEHFQGNYDYYLERKAYLKEKALSDNKNGQADTSEENSKKLSWQEQKKEAAEKKKKENRIKEIEEKIDVLENEISEIEEKFQSQEIATNSAKLNELTKQSEEKKEELQILYEEWEELNSN